PFAWDLVDASSPERRYRRFSASPAPGTARVYTEIGDWPDWGEFSLTAPADESLTAQAGPSDLVRGGFAARGVLTGDPGNRRWSATDPPVAFAFAWTHPGVGSAGVAQRLFLAHG